jgi:hypothetical protein
MQLSHKLLGGFFVSLSYCPRFVPQDFLLHYRFDGFSQDHGLA